MSDLEELYQEIVMEHNRSPRNFHRIEDSDYSADGFNPFCGDSIVLDLKMENNLITDIGFESSGCAISRASSSLMTDKVKGKSREDTNEIFDAFRRLMTRISKGTSDSDILGDLEVLEGVSEFPVRVKCATLPWHTLKAALEGNKTAVSTE